MNSQPPGAGNTLLPLARAAIAHALGLSATAPHAAAAWLRAPGASVITLRRDGTLRGRTGTLHPVRPLVEDVTVNAVAAALHDPGQNALTAPELETVTIEVAVLSELAALPSDEEQVRSLLQPRQHGLALRYGHHHSVFLPEAWQLHPDAAEFLAALKYRAGLPPDFWDPGLQLHRFSTAVWLEPGTATA